MPSYSPVLTRFLVCYRHPDHEWRWLALCATERAATAIVQHAWPEHTNIERAIWSAQMPARLVHQWADLPQEFV